MYSEYRSEKALSDTKSEMQDVQKNIYRRCVHAKQDYIVHMRPNEEPPEFGQPMRDLEFLLEPDTVFFNHGGAGAIPRRVFEEYHRYATYPI